MSLPPPELEALWSRTWTEALALWSPYLRLRPPAFLWTPQEEKKQGLSSSFAMIRFLDTQVVVSLRQVKEEGLEDHALSILAHEIGHHIYAPGDLGEHARMLARMGRMLPGFEDRAPEVANLYTDLLINHRLRTRHQLPLEAIYRKFAPDMSGRRLGLWYLRIYELLWNLPGGTLAQGEVTPEEEGEAVLAGRIIRRFAERPGEAAGRFAALALGRLLADRTDQKASVQPWGDILRAAEGAGVPVGLTRDDAAPEDLVHPALDPGLNDLPVPADADAATGEAPGTGAGGGGGGQTRSPEDYHRLLGLMGLQMPEEEAAMNYYRELAQPLVIPFPRRSVPPAQEPHPEGVEVWDLGRPLEKIDWLESLLRSPAVIPGFTAVERLEGLSPGPEKAPRPLNLDIYIDSSGSIPDPRRVFSPLCLAGAVMALSALRAGARVRAVLWSGPGQVAGTPGFTRDQKEVFRILTAYFGGSTAFPLGQMADFYRQDKGPEALGRGEKAHLLVISDEGVDTMLTPSARIPQPPETIGETLKKAGGGGSLVLNIAYDAWLGERAALDLQALGWALYRVRSWEEMIGFARDFSRRTWGKDVT